jgi:hypothetical protein
LLTLALSRRAWLNSLQIPDHAESLRAQVAVAEEEESFADVEEKAVEEPPSPHAPVRSHPPAA